MKLLKKKHRKLPLQTPKVRWNIKQSFKREKKTIGRHATSARFFSSRAQTNPTNPTGRKQHNVRIIVFIRPNYLIDQRHSRVPKQAPRFYNLRRFCLGWAREIISLFYIARGAVVRRQRQLASADFQCAFKVIKKKTPNKLYTLCSIFFSVIVLGAITFNSFVFGTPTTEKLPNNNGNI